MEKENKELNKNLYDYQNQRIDEKIKTINEYLTKTIKNINIDDSGYFSQQFLSPIRSFIEKLMTKIYSLSNEEIFDDIFSKNSFEKILKWIKSKREYDFLIKLHSIFQKTISHSLIKESDSKFLLSYIYDGLFFLKEFFYKNYSINLLENINELLSIFETKNEYYLKVFQLFNEIDFSKVYENNNKNKFYVIKQNLIVSKGKKIYEISLSLANDRDNKNERIIIFSRDKIQSNY
ncbi:MAG: hypothetical protein K2I76_03080, partial [Malacoplasma sp.]|nr:hypothetical protein [Malacoplasma sp.]